MVLAILAGKKTQTRRIARNVSTVVDGVPREGITKSTVPAGTVGESVSCPYGLPGDRLWVRETWAAADSMYGEEKDTPQTIAYYADASAVVFDGACRPHRVHDVNAWNWSRLRKRPSIYMPRWASRLTLEVTGVRVERLQDIGPRDSVAEGITFHDGYFLGGPHPIKGTPKVFHLAEQAYADLWDTINGKRAPWASNPWVWVVEFQPVSTKDATS
jgi:hypothetical protein